MLQPVEIQSYSVYIECEQMSMLPALCIQCNDFALFISKRDLTEIAIIAGILKVILVAQCVKGLLPR